MKKLLSLGTIAAIVAPVASVVACGNLSTTKNTTENNTDSNSFFSNGFIKDLQKHEFKNVDQTYTLKQIKNEFGPIWIHDAEMDYWIDGDTPVVKGITPEIENKSTYHIRIEAIDTPELHTDGNLTTGKELEYAQKAKEFGEQEIPKGTHFKLVSNGAKSYDRVVGSLFYQADPKQDPDGDDTIYKSYANQIIKNGLCMPFMEANGINIEGNITHLIGPSFADSYNWAIKHKAGMFKEEVNDILGVHGSTDDTAWRWRSSRPEEADANAYDRLD